MPVRVIKKQKPIEYIIMLPQWQPEGTEIVLDEDLIKQLRDELNKLKLD